MGLQEQVRKLLIAGAIGTLMTCPVFGQKHENEATGGKTESAELATQATPGGVLIRADFPGTANWGKVRKGAVMEGKLALPVYESDRIAAPKDSPIRITVQSVEKVRRQTGFWQKAGHTIVQAFNPLEKVTPDEYRVTLTAAELSLPNGKKAALHARVLRAGLGVNVEPPRAAASARTAAANRKGHPSLVLEVEKGTLPEPESGNIVLAATAPATTPAYLLTSLRASKNHAGDTFEAELAEPLQLGGRTFAAQTRVEGTVTRSVPPRMLSRAGKLYLHIDRIEAPGGQAIETDGTLAEAEADKQMRFALDDEGGLHGRKPGLVNGLVDLGYAYALGKVADDISETPIRAIGASMSDAAVANAARFVGLGTAAAFLVTRRGRDVYLPKYSLIEIEFGRAMGRGLKDSQH